MRDDYSDSAAKGQVTLRKEVLQHLGVKPGDKIAVDVLRDGKARLSAVKPKDAGSLHRPGEPAMSIEIN